MPVPAGTRARSSENDSSPPAEAAYANDRKRHRLFAQFVAHHAGTAMVNASLANKEFLDAEN
jgi:hypothetical protein